MWRPDPLVICFSVIHQVSQKPSLVVNCIRIFGANFLEQLFRSFLLDGFLIVISEMISCIRTHLDAISIVAVAEVLNGFLEIVLFFFPATHLSKIKQSTTSTVGFVEFLNQFLETVFRFLTLPVPICHLVKVFDFSQLLT